MRACRGHRGCGRCSGGGRRLGGTGCGAGRPVFGGTGRLVGRGRRPRRAGRYLRSPGGWGRGSGHLPNKVSRFLSSGGRRRGGGHLLHCDGRLYDVGRRFSSDSRHLLNDLRDLLDRGGCLIEGDGHLLNANGSPHGAGDGFVHEGRQLFGDTGYGPRLGGTGLRRPRAGGVGNDARGLFRRVAYREGARMGGLRALPGGGRAGLIGGTGRRRDRGLRGLLGGVVDAIPALLLGILGVFSAHGDLLHAHTVAVGLSCTRKACRVGKLWG